MSVENLSEEKDWNMLGTLKSLKAVLDDLMEQEGDCDKIYNHFGYMAENETEAKKKLLYFAVESIYALSDSDCENMLVLLRGKANIGSDCKEVVMDMSLDHEEVVIDINPYVLSKYLESKEWIEYPIKRDKIKVFQLEKGGERYQVSIPFDKSFSDYHDVMYETIKTIARAEKKTAEQISFYLDNLALGEYIEKYLPDADVKEAKEIYKEFERKGEK